MTMAKAQRQRAIVDMLRELGSCSQDDIAARLHAEGYPVTQATVSRDLDQIGAMKIRRGRGVAYSLPNLRAPRDSATERMQRIFGEWVQSVDTAGNLIVVRTPPGSAHVVSLAVDQAKLPEVAGTIAGDDTMFIAVRSPLPAEPLAERLRALVGAA